MLWVALGVVVVIGLLVVWLALALGVAASRADDVLELERRRRGIYP